MDLRQLLQIRNFILLDAHHAFVQLALQPVGVAAACPWLIVGAASVESLAAGLDMRQWTLLATVRRPADANDNVLLYQRASR